MAFFRAHTLRWVLRGAITLLFVVMVNRGITKAQIGVLGVHLVPGLLAGAVLFGLMSLFFQLLRWHAILKAQGFGVTLYHSFKMFAWGNLLAFITPGRVGEFGRAIALDSGRRADAVASVAVDKIFAVLSAVFFGALGMGAQFFIRGSRPPQQLIVCMAGFCIVVPVIAAIIPMFCKKRASSGRIGSLLRHFHATLDAMPRFVGWNTIGYSLLAQGALLIQTAMIVSMFGNGSFIGSMIIAAEVYAFMLFLPFFIANMGLREYSFGMMFENMHLHFDQTLDIGSAALGVSLLILIINIVLPAVVGLCIMLIDKKHKSTI